MNRCRIEDHNVGPHAVLENAAIGEAHPLRGQSRKLANGIFERQRLFFADIFAENAGKGSVRPRMRMRLAENSFG